MPANSRLDLIQRLKC